MATATSTGASLSSLNELRDRLELEWGEMAEIIGVDPSTLHRWRKGESRPRPMAWTRITQIDELLQILPRVFAGPDLARQWIRTATPKSLGGSMTPIEVMKTGRIDRVLALLQFLGRGA